MPSPCGKTRNWKTFAVDMEAGPQRRPTYRTTVYVQARTGEAAIACAKRNLYRNPTGCRFQAPLAGPRELGCVPTPASHPAIHHAECNE